VSGAPHEVATRLAVVRERIAAAARAAGREPSSVRLVAVTKKLGPELVRAAFEAGQRDFGENYVQEAVAKIAGLAAELPGARWHLLGRLQSNKAAAAARSFALLHGIDSAGTVAALSRAALHEGRTLDLLLQVRLGERRHAGSAPGAARGGVEPENAAAFLEQAQAHEGVRFVGLMGVADPDLAARPQFAALRELSLRLAALGLERAPLGELSMGMTGDFEDAIAEGATLVRIGTAIFGERQVGQAVR
jgi:pyridoxal phosphate enzyme (YggS family)